METALDYTDDKVAWFTTDEVKWKRRLDEWALQYPDEVKIRTRPENNDGCMVANIPASWLRIRPPIKRNMTEEQRKAIGERAKMAWSAKKERTDGIEDPDDMEDDNENA